MTTEQVSGSLPLCDGYVPRDYLDPLRMILTADPEDIVRAARELSITSEEAMLRMEMLTAAMRGNAEQHV